MTVEWKAAARAELRTIPRDQAITILQAITRLVRDDRGDVTRLAGSPGEFRLRVGDWRVRFERIPGGLRILHVRNRSQAYR